MMEKNKTSLHGIYILYGFSKLENVGPSPSLRNQA